MYRHLACLILGPFQLDFIYTCIKQDASLSRHWKSRSCDTRFKVFTVAPFVDLATFAEPLKSYTILQQSVCVR